MMRLLRLSEYRTTDAVPLLPEEIDAIPRSAQITVAPTPGTQGCFDLTPGSRIGTIELGDLRILIRPKVPIRNVLFLLSFAVDPHNWRDQGFDFGEEDSLVEAVIPGFVTQVTRAFRSGVLQGYRSEDASSTTIRGRLRFEDQIRDRFGVFPPAEIRFDEFTEDIELNRIIKAAAARLGRLRLRSTEVRRSLRSIDTALARVQHVEYAPSALPELSYDRLNQHYRPAAELAKLIIRATAFELRHGQIRSGGFLVDMNRVFEDFVVAALRDALDLSPASFPQGARGRQLFLDEARWIRLEPDLSWWEGSRCVFVGDVKYKRIAIRGVKHPDIYQLHAYCSAAGLSGGLLIYAAGEGEPASHRLVPSEKVLTVMTLDLSGDPNDILHQVRRLADHIVTLRRPRAAAQAMGGDA